MQRDRRRRSRGKKIKVDFPIRDEPDIDSVATKFTRAFAIRPIDSPWEEKIFNISYASEADLKAHGVIPDPIGTMRLYEEFPLESPPEPVFGDYDLDFPELSDHNDNEWTDEWTNEWMNGWNEWVDGWDEWNGWMDYYSMFSSSPMPIVVNIRLSDPRDIIAASMDNLPLPEVMENLGLASAEQFQGEMVELLNNLNDKLLHTSYMSVFAAKEHNFEYIYKYSRFPGDEMTIKIVITGDRYVSKYYHGAISIRSQTTVYIEEDHVSIEVNKPYIQILFGGL